MKKSKNKKPAPANIEYYTEDTRGDWRLKPFVQVFDILLKNTNLRYLRLFPGCNEYFIYDFDKNYYVSLNPSEIFIVIHKEVKVVGSTELREPQNVTKAFNYYKISIGKTGRPPHNPFLLSMKNGIFDLKTKELRPHTPELFVTYKVTYEWDPNAACPIFREFITSFCRNFQDRELFLQAVCYIVMYQMTNCQVFINLLGPGSTGKSTFAIILTALIDKEATLTTSLKALNSDPFELVNLERKKLILLSDSERYTGDLSVLKQICGGDAVKGRKKFHQGAIEVHPEGILLLVTNHPLMANDASNSILRRIRTFPADAVSSKKESLLYYSNDKWNGPLVAELPGILNWVLAINEQTASQMMRETYIMAPSMKPAFLDNEVRLNPLVSWIGEELTPGDGAYVGFIPEFGARAYIEHKQRRTLYPAYIAWCKKQHQKEMTHRAFLENLVRTLSQMDSFQTKKVKKEFGVYIEGVCLQNTVFEKDYSYGSPLHLPTNPLVLPSNAETVNPKGYLPPDAGNLHPNLDPQLYAKYTHLLRKTELKDSLNKTAKQISDSVIPIIVNELTKQCKINSQSYTDSVCEVVTKSVGTLRKFGAIPYTYKPSGCSPRIVPQNYGATINAIKSQVRLHSYEQMAKEAKKMGYLIVDLDLVSCYVSILLGLYPEALSAIQKAIETIGLWEFIKAEFEANGKSEYYSKPAVKIATYSSFFGGGHNAMISGIMDFFRQDLGLLEKEFKIHPSYEDLHSLAREISSQLMNSDIIIDFKSISKWIFDAYNGQLLIGPTGHAYKVSEHTFKTAYANYLQSFEFALLAQATLDTTNKYPEVQLIGHYHDGNVLAIPESAYTEVLEYMEAQVKTVGTRVGLSYPQKIQVKHLFPKATFPLLGGIVPSRV